jgi:hypothetical protein
MKAPPMSETAWQSRVVDYARLNQWRVFHAPDNRPDARGRKQTVEAGFPDLVLVRTGRLVFAELKKDGEKPTQAQLDWHWDLGGIGRVETYVWCPVDWDTVQTILARRTTAAATDG